jgi:hypothetical protein
MLQASVQLHLFTHKTTDVSLVKLVNQKKVFCTVFLQANIIDIGPVWHLVIDHVTHVVCLAQNVVAWVEEHLDAVSHFNIQAYHYQ